MPSACAARGPAMLNRLAIHQDLAAIRADRCRTGSSSAWICRRRFRPSGRELRPRADRTARRAGRERRESAFRCRSCEQVRSCGTPRARKVDDDLYQVPAIFRELRQPLWQVLQRQDGRDQLVAVNPTLRNAAMTVSKSCSCALRLPIRRISRL